MPQNMVAMTPQQVRQIRVPRGIVWGEEDTTSGGSSASTGVIIGVIVAILVIWGGLGVAIVNLRRSPEAPLVVRDFGRLVLLLALPMALLLFRPARRTG